MTTPPKSTAPHFPHDSGMWSSRRIAVLKAHFGLEGYAMWNLLLEALCQSDGFRLRVSETDLESLAALWGQKVERLKEFLLCLDRLGLVEIADGRLWAPSLTERLRPMMRARERKRRWAARRRKQDETGVERRPSEQPSHILPNPHNNEQD